MLIKFKGYVIDADSVAAVSAVYAEVDDGAFAFQILLKGGQSITVTGATAAPERKAKIARWTFLRLWRKGRTALTTMDAIAP